MIQTGFTFGISLLFIQPCVSGLCSTCLEERCYDNGECKFGCVPGYVGGYCELPCPSRCLNNACYIDRIKGTITCIDGCEPGYCGAKCSYKCPGDCVTCDRQCDSCNVTLCPEGQYGPGCNKTCIPRYEKCDRENGQCIRCRRGYYGDECTHECMSCFTREDQITDMCLSGCEQCKSQKTCEPGFNGRRCERRCSGGCQQSHGDSRTCNRATGECSAGCVSGYHGLTCNHTCSEHCVSGRCNRATGECSDGCVSGYHGLTCNYTCSEHCVSGRCNRATEACSEGCVPGYHGLTCNYTCNRFCVAGTCNQNNGTCTSGCMIGYQRKFDLCEGLNWPLLVIIPTLSVLLACLLVGACVCRVRRKCGRAQLAPRSERDINDKTKEPIELSKYLMKPNKGTEDETVVNACNESTRL